MKSQLMCVLLMIVVACTAPFGQHSVQQAQSADDPQLDTRIGPPIPEKYKAIRDSQNWLNPFLSVCPQGVILNVRSLSHETQTVRIEELRKTLTSLPVQGWPYGRIVALSDCSIGVPGDEEGSRQRMRDVQAVFKALRLEVSLWPS